MPKISIIIPAYNAEKYIEECIESVINQTMRDYEIIAIDDGSTDRTGQILDKYSKKIPFLHVVHQNNQGLYRSRQIGLSLATGEYIGWVDADDFIDPDMFITMYQEALENESELVICNYNWFPTKPKLKEKWYREFTGKVNTEFIERNSQPWNKLVKRELLDRLNIGGFFVKCFDEVYILVLMSAKNPVCISKCLYNYRISDGTMSVNYSNIEHYKRFIQASIALKERASILFHLDKYWQDYFDYRVNYYRIQTMIVSAYVGNYKEYKEQKDELYNNTVRFNKNQHFWRILINNFGIVKAMAMGIIVPISYPITRIMSGFAFGKYS